MTRQATVVSKAEISYSEGKMLDLQNGVCTKPATWLGKNLQRGRFASSEEVRDARTDTAARKVLAYAELETGINR
jgi:hypothetical protein